MELLHKDRETLAYPVIDPTRDEPESRITRFTASLKRFTDLSTAWKTGQGATSSDFSK
jgi:hypothetical protein